MSEPDHSDNFEALRDLANARYYDWCSREVRPERDSRFAELKKKKFTGGRALDALRITHELLTRKVRKRISIYYSIARKRQNWEMLSPPRLDEFRERIMRSVGADLESLKGRTKREANAVGFPQSALPNELRYDDVRAEILTIVNTALARLNAEGNVHNDLPDRSAPAPVRELSQDSSAAEERVPGRSRMPTTLSPAERMRELADDPFIRHTETRASLEFHRCAHENQAKWWVIEKQAYLIYPRHPSVEELREALENPADVLDATLGEMAAANYAATIIEAMFYAAMSSIQGPELETFIQECTRNYTEKACKLLRPASENKDSRNRISHFIDLATTTALTSVRMVSHVQAGLKNGMEWEDLARMVPRRSAIPDDDDEIEALLTDTDHAGTESQVSTTPSSAGQSFPVDGVDSSQAERAAKRQAMIMPILQQKRWRRGKWATEAGVGKNCIYEYLKGRRNPGYDNRKPMAEALGLTEDQLPQ